MTTEKGSAIEKWIIETGESEDCLRECLGPDIEDAFAANLKFGTGGLRGKMGPGLNRMNILTVGRASQGLSDYLKMKRCDQPVVICRDTRINSALFAKRAASVFAANNVLVKVVEKPAPTPLLSFAVRKLGCSAGVMITASHNAAEYNGYKVYGSDGGQITIGVAHDIQEQIDSIDPYHDVYSVDYDEACSHGLIEVVDNDLIDAYMAAVLANSTKEDCGNLSVVYTPLNGTGAVFATRLFKEMGIARVHYVGEQMEPDGSFPTCPVPNPENVESLRLGMRYCEQYDADLLLATDPDADRIGVAVRHNGRYRVLSGNEIGLLLFDYLTSEKTRKNEGCRQVVLTTVVSAPMADDMALNRGVELRRTLTGFKYIGEQVGFLEDGGHPSKFLFGFEESCGYLAGSYARDKDGIEGAMLVLEMAAYWKRRGLSLVEALQFLYSTYGYWRDGQISRSYPSDGGAFGMEELMTGLRCDPPSHLGGYMVDKFIDYASGIPMPTVNAVDEGRDILPSTNLVEMLLSDGSRVFIRPSGTEPKIKVYVYAYGESEMCAERAYISIATDISVLLGEG